MEKIKMVSCKTCEHSKQRPVCEINNKLILNEKLRLEDCPLDGIDKDRYELLQKILDMPMEEVEKQLQVYLDMEGTEVADVYNGILSVYHYNDYVSDKFVYDMEIELKYQLFIFQTCFEIEETEEIIPERKVITKELNQIYYIE